MKTLYSILCITLIISACVPPEDLEKAIEEGQGYDSTKEVNGTYMGVKVE